MTILLFTNISNISIIFIFLCTKKNLPKCQRSSIQQQHGAGLIVKKWFCLIHVILNSTSWIYDWVHMLIKHCILSFDLIWYCRIYQYIVLWTIDGLFIVCCQFVALTEGLFTGVFLVKSYQFLPTSMLRRSAMKRELVSEEHKSDSNKLVNNSEKSFSYLS